MCVTVTVGNKIALLHSGCFQDETLFQEETQFQDETLF
ncbi:hypothetical protein Q7O_001062 [Pectobacterium carotovorum subsp. carotovorum PCCS1]|nr:hypothetical protein [Pectobacterium carotovorum subsp. carotovorum PCCS1]